MAAAARLRRRKFGALLVLIGIVGMVGGVLMPSAGAETSGVIAICNNVADATDYATCDAHGQIEWQIDEDGNLEIDIDGFDDNEWESIAICIPAVGPTQSADCTGSDPEALVPGDDFVVMGVTGLDYGQVEATFDCIGELTAEVEEAALPAFPFSFSVHVNGCGADNQGNTEEAFAAGITEPTTTTTEATTTSTEETTTTTEATTTTTEATTTTTEATTTTTEDTTTTTEATTTTTEATTTTTEGAVVLPTTIVPTTAPEVTTTTEAVVPTTEAPTSTMQAAVLGARQERPRAQGALARTGVDGRLMFLGGLALFLGGVASVFGDPTTARRRV